MVRHIRVKRHLRNLPGKKDKNISIEEYNRKINDRNFLNNYENFDKNIENVFQRCPKCNFRNMFRINPNVACIKKCDKCNYPINMNYNN